jgi:hypothetical protein
MRREDSIFTPGRKRVINVVPIVFNVFSPWVLFTVLLFLYTSEQHFRFPQAVDTIMAAISAVVLGISGFFVCLTRNSFDPVWYKMTFVLHLLAVLLAFGIGSWNFTTYLNPYFQLNKLQSYPQLDVTKTPGKTVQDAGRVYFAAGTKVDTTRSWHFRAGNLYCVAPIVGADGQSDVDFWAIGKGCCSESSADFRCGNGELALASHMFSARAGLRFIESDYWNPERHFYRLAVDAAAEMFGMTAKDPLFFTWTQDPLRVMSELKNKGWSNFILGVQAFLTLDVTIVVFATCRFAFIGRTPEEKPLVEDDEYL